MTDNTNEKKNSSGSRSQHALEKQEILEKRLLKALRAPTRSIPRLTESDPVSLSLAQQRLWFLEQLIPGSSLYNIPLRFNLTGSLNVKALEQSLNQIVQRHEILRAVFIAENEQPQQFFLPQLYLPLPIVDLEHLSGARQQIEMWKIINVEAQKPFNLTSGPLIRVVLLRMSQTEHILLVTIHHAVFDGWSANILQKELAAFYEAFLVGQAPTFVELPIRYKDYAVWQRQWLQNSHLQVQLDYWRQQLAYTSNLELPIDRPRPRRRSVQGASYYFTLPRHLFDALQDLGRREKVTLFMLLLAAFQILLYRYSGQEDIVVGTPVAGRLREETEELIGFFVNTLPLRTNLGGNPSFYDLLKRVREVTLGALAHQDIPFERLVEELRPSRENSSNPFFQVMFVLQNAFAEPVSLPDLRMHLEVGDNGTAQFDFTFEMIENSEGLSGRVEYNTHLFETATIERMVGHWRTLLENIVSDPEKRISNLPLLTQTEMHQLLVDWNATQSAYPQDQCLHQLFEKQAERTPDAIAVIFEERHLTYQELQQQANRLAHYLQRLGVGSEVRVGLCVERSLEMIVGLLGILKAGGAYVPLDPTYPQERLAFMVEDAQIAITVTQSRFLETIPQQMSRLICLDTDWNKILGESSQNVCSDVSASNLAYMIYTSGSTGKPKGVMVNHRGVCNLAVAQQQTFGVGAGDRVLQFASLSFDTSVWEIIMALSSGAALLLATRMSLLPDQPLIDLLQQQRITVATFPPSVLINLPDAQLPELQTLIAGGEACPASVVERWASGRHFFNAYGPTETTVCSIVAAGIAPGSTPPIGRPLANTQVYILDTHQQLVPVGIAGELYIGGDGVTRGYWQRPELTAERFVCNPFGRDPQARMYKTGDLVRYLPDGSIEFLGRIDHQVKIRGFRIEPGEIESVLLQHSAVREAVVLPGEKHSGDAHLIGYVTVQRTGELVPQQEEPPVGAELRRWLQERLPAHMIPMAVLVIKEMPLTPNGKLDRRALLAFSQLQPLPEPSFVKPRTTMEEMLAAIWSEILEIEQISLYDDFFALGGHSLLATRLVTRLRKDFQVELPLQAIFDAPTLIHLSQVIEESRRQHQGVSLPPLLPVSRDQALPLSFAQQRLWFFEQLNPGTSSYNSPMAARLYGEMNVKALAQSLNELVQRHEVLRTNFVVRGTQPVQLIAPARQVDITRLDLRALPSAECEQRVLQSIALEAERPFDLTTDTLLRVTLLQLSLTEHILVVVMHHIITDGWSLEIFMRELITLYDAFAQDKVAQLPALSVQYAEYTIWQRNYLQGEILQKHLQYWKKQIAGAPTLLALPIDRPRTRQARLQGSHLPFALSIPVSQALKRVSQQEGVTLFMTLLTVFQVLLLHYTQQDDFLLGTPIANRNHEEIAALIGFFVNTIVVRSDLRGNPSIQEVLRRVRETLIGAYTHQDLPFDRLVEELQFQRDLSYHPLFQVMFDYNGGSHQSVKSSTLAFQPFPLTKQTTAFDLILSMGESDNGINGSFIYNVDLFDATTIEDMMSHYIFLLENLEQNLNKLIMDEYFLKKVDVEKLREKQRPLQTRSALPQESVGQEHALNDHKAQLVARQTALSHSKRTLLEQRIRSLGKKEH